MNATLHALYRRLVYDPSGCLLWTGATDRGYGKANIGRKNLRVHRYVYETLHGPVGEFDLDHLCRVRACANPHHLEPVTRAVNLRRGAGVGGVLSKQPDRGTGLGEDPVLCPVEEVA